MIGTVRYSISEIGALSGLGSRLPSNCVLFVLT